MKRKTQMRRSHRAAAILLAALWPAAAGAADYLSDAGRLMSAGDLAGARLQLRNALKADPGNAAAHYQLGQVDLQLGDPVAAEKEAQAARDGGYDAASALALLTTTYLSEGRARDLLREFPAGEGAPDAAAAVAVARGKAQMVLDHPEQAEASFADARRLAPGSAAPLLAEAQLALSRRDTAAASEKVEAALQIDPHSAEALQRKSSLLADKGDVVGAVAAADAAVAAAPGQFAYRLDRAGVLVALNQNAPARADVDAVLQASPGNARATYYRAVLLTRAGDFAAANTDLDKLSGVIAQFPGALLMQALVKQRLGQTEQALDAATRYVARTPEDPRGVVLLAELQLQNKRPDQAVQTLTPMVVAGTKDPAVYDLRGTALNLLGRPQDALQDYQKALVLKPDNAALLARTGATQLALNQPDNAAASLARSVSLAPAQPETETLLTTALLDSGRFPEAQKAIDQLRAQGGHADTVALLAAGMELAKFNLPEAQKGFEAILHDHPDSVPGHLGLARVALLQGRTDEWARLMGEVLAHEPAREPAVEELAEMMLRQKRTADAVGVLERAHAAAPSDLRFTSRLASLYIATGVPQKALDLVGDSTALPALLIKAAAQTVLKQDAAQATYRQVLAANPGLTFARIQLVRMLTASDPAGARAVLNDGLLTDGQNEDLLKASVDLDAKDGGLPAALASAAVLASDPAHQPASLVLEGDLYMSAKRFDDAAKAYAGSLKATPSERLALRLAGARIAAGQADQAASGLRDWRAQHPGDVGAEQMLSDLDLNAHRLDSAKALLTDLLAKRPGDARAMNNLAWLDGQNKDPQAAALAQRAYQLAPSPQTADTWGYVLAMTGRGDHGVGLLRVATEQAPNDPAMKYHLAVALKATGQSAEAAKLLTPLVDGPEFPEKPQARQLLTSLNSKP